MSRQFPVAFAVMVCSLFLLFSFPVAAAEWVPAGLAHPGFRITDVALSGDGAYGAIAGDGGIILLTADGDECWRSPEGGYRSVSLSGNGSILAAGGDGIALMDKNSTTIATIRTKNYVNDLSVTGDGTRIAAAVDDETLRLYTSAGLLVWSTETGDDLVSVSISPDGTYIAGGTVTGNVVLFSASGKERWTYALSRQPVTAVAVADGAKSVAAVSEDGAVSLLSRAGGLLWSGSAPHAGGVAVTADGGTAAVADGKGFRILGRDGTPAGVIPNIDASVSVSMDNDGTLIVVTDGVRINAFIQDSGAPDGDPTPVETAMPVSEGSPSPTSEETPLSDEKTPVPTQSPCPLVMGIGGVLLAGHILKGRRS